MKNWIKENLFCVDGKRLDSNKLRILGSQHPAFSSKIAQDIFWASTWAERIYCILNDIDKQPKCLYCGNVTQYFKSKKSYASHCSKKCISKSKITKIKKRNQSIEKYGTTCTANSKSSKLKSKITREKKYKIDPKYIWHRKHISDNTWYKINSKDWLYEQHVIKKLSCQEISDLLRDVSKNFILTSLRDKGIIVKRHNQSAPEREITSFIKSKTDLEIITNDRTSIAPFELDIYIPLHKIAIEYHGLYWHSYDHVESSHERRRHYYKKEKCDSSGIDLLQFFEDEWLNKKDICKSMILSRLGIHKKIHARKCIIKEIPTKEKNAFLEQNHLQGKCGSKVNLGLYHEDELVALMTFGVPRFNKNFDWELIRFCNKLNTQVVGGASKLLKNFQRNHEGSMISYADRRYSNGNLYTKLGFNAMKNNTNPNYYYTKNQIRYTRMQFQKHKLVKKLVNFDPKLTEAENMFANGFKRIWDAGNFSFILSK